jgi:hypothetical protein
VKKGWKKWTFFTNLSTEKFEMFNQCKDILESLPPKMTIFVDMAEIQNHWSGVWRNSNYTQSFIESPIARIQPWE